jgi:hypothetical protein
MGFKIKMSIIGFYRQITIIAVYKSKSAEHAKALDIRER